jgi:hypothetical protein
MEAFTSGKVGMPCESSGDCKSSFPNDGGVDGRCEEVRSFLLTSIQ